jgi:hypothetical protein
MMLLMEYMDDIVIDVIVIDAFVVDVFGLVIVMDAVMVCFHQP